MSSKLMTELLGSAQAHIPSLGFTVQAIQAGARQSGQISPSTVAELFPSAPSTAQSLLQRFDRDHLQKYSRQYMQRKLRTKEEQIEAYTEALDVLREKLIASENVKTKLPDALASLILTTLPFVPISVPNPAPIYHRAHSIVDEALHLTGWTGALSTDWYSRRIALSTSFMLAELHMISPEQQNNSDITPSIALFNRLTSSALVGKEADEREQNARKQGSFPALNQWAKWGSHGWIGILRSYGL